MTRILGTGGRIARGAPAIPHANINRANQPRLVIPPLSRNAARAAGAGGE